MKTYKGLFLKIISCKNIVLAFKKASELKSFRRSVLIFEKNLSLNFIGIIRDLVKGTYKHGEYRFFKIFEKKERQISAAPFRDRVVHHAVYQILNPIYDRKFIFDSFANRDKKGTHKAIKRLQFFLRKIDFSRQSDKISKRENFTSLTHLKGKNIYCLKCDIAKCFPSINHQKLIEIIQKTIQDQKVLWLLREIISSYETGNEFDSLFTPDSPFLKLRPRGIPIGNLTSQLFINIFLNELDQYIKHKLKIRYYIRYVDDFVILSPNKRYLHQTRDRVRTFLREELLLELHPKKQSIFPVEKGIDFLGHVIFKNFTLLRKSNKEAFRKKLKKLKKGLGQNKVSEEEMRRSITSWLAHAQFSDTFRLRKRMIGLSIKAENQKTIKKIISVLKEDFQRQARESSVQLGLFDIPEKQKSDRQ